MAMVQVMQKVMQNVLGFEYQLSGIDYHQPNFVHADATQQQFEELLSSRNETIFSLFTRAMEMEGNEEMQACLEEIGGEELSLEMLMALAEMDPTKFKKSMARFLANSESLIQVMNGDEGSVLITERNKIVMNVVDQQLDLGNKQIAIFYGAGHMPDFRDRLVSRGFKEEYTIWDAAWSIGNHEETTTGIGLIENLLTDGDLFDSLSALFRTLTEQE